MQPEPTPPPSDEEVEMASSSNSPPPPPPGGSPIVMPIIDPVTTSGKEYDVKKKRKTQAGNAASTRHRKYIKKNCSNEGFF